jgi:glycosyltransferase involved in cell wall biosynthesis
MTPTVLVVSNLYPPHIVGGAELVAHYQAKELKKLGARVHVFAGEGHAQGVHYAVSEEIYDGVPVERIFLNTGDFRSESLNFLHPAVEERFTRTLDRVRPDIVHMHNLIGLSCGLPSIAARRGIRVVLTLHDHWGFCLRNTVVNVNNEICRDFSRCANCQRSIDGDGDLKLPIRMRNDYIDLQLQSVGAFVFPSEYLSRAYAKAGFPADRMHVLWNGIDVARFRRVRKQPQSGPLRFTYIGYLGEHKGLGVLFDSLGLIRDREFQINLVGSGHLRPALEARAKGMGIADRVRFWGQVHHGSIERVFEQTDVQLMPSIWPENQPVSITEAMATSTPVLASRIGGIAELVEDGVNGLLFEAGDAAQLATKMTLLLDEPNRVAQLGQNGFNKIQHVSLDRQAEKILDLYRNTPRVDDFQVDVPLILCCGPRFDDCAYKAVSEIGARFGVRSHRFVMHDWVPDYQAAAARVLFVLPGASLHDVMPLLRYKVPLVVPADTESLVKLCREKQCGLYYRTSQEAAECLIWLFEHSADQAWLAGNAYLASDESHAASLGGEPVLSR